MVDFVSPSQEREREPVVQDGLAREGNLDILMSWGRTLTHRYLDMSDWVPLGCYIGALDGFICHSGTSIFQTGCSLSAILVPLVDLGTRNIDIFVSLGQVECS